MTISVGNNGGPDVKIEPVNGAGRILLQNPSAATVNLLFHQGFGATPPTDTNGAVLQPGESIMLVFDRPVFLNSPANAAATCVYVPLA